MLFDPPAIIPRQSSHKRKLFFTADEHYFHAKIIQYQGRPFPNVATMNETLWVNHNSVVRPCDVTIHVGDICFGHAQELIRVLRTLNGHHCLMDGSHDRALKELVTQGIPKDLEKKVTILPKLFEFTFNGITISLCHYAMDRWCKSHYGNLHGYGHSHGNRTSDDRAIDVGVDPNNYFPILIEDFIQKATAKKAFKPMAPRQPASNHHE